MKAYKINILNINLFSLILLTIFLITIIPFLIGIIFFINVNPLCNKLNILKDVIFSFNWDPQNGKYGIANFIVVSIKITIISFLISSILSIFATIYIYLFLPKKINRILSNVLELVSYMPSVLFGYWGIMILLPIFKMINTNIKFTDEIAIIISYSLVLSFVIIPFLITNFLKLFNNFPNNYLIAFQISGLDKLDVTKIIIKKNYKSIIHFSIISLTKILGEAIALWMIFNSIMASKSIVNINIYPLTVLITENYSNLLSSQELKQIITFSALLVFIANFGINLLINIYCSKNFKNDNKY